MSNSKKNVSAALAFAAVSLVPVAAFAADGAMDVHASAAAAGGLAMGLAALGGTLAQGKATAAALEGIARNPGAAARMQQPLILGLAFIESLVIFALVVALMYKSVAAP